jgi:hypothetical protein
VPIADCRLPIGVPIADWRLTDWRLTIDGLAIDGLAIGDWKDLQLGGVALMGVIATLAEGPSHSC